MDAPNLHQSLENAFNALEALKARIQGREEQSASPPEGELPSAYQEAIANLTTHLNAVAEMEPSATQASQPVVPSVDIVAPVVAPVVIPPPMPAPRVATIGEKIIQVPVRQRTGQARPSEGTVRSFALELPSTPFNPRSNASDVAPPSQAQPTPGMPANTPMAAQVLASLSALGLKFPVPAAPPQRLTRVQEEIPTITTSPVPAVLEAAAAAVGPQPPLGRRAAAVRAAEAAAALLPRPRPARKENVTTNGRKSCNCKRSQCLKLYCECFAAGGYCLPGCQCFNCLNTVTEAVVVERARAVILSKNPRAFNDKVVGDTHKKGCRCKRSKCLKKYCECYNAGIKCNPEVCQCEGCHNISLGGDDDNGFVDEPLPFGSEDEAAEIDSDSAEKAPLPDTDAFDGNDDEDTAQVNLQPAPVAAPLAAIAAALAGNNNPGSVGPGPAPLPLFRPQIPIPANMAMLPPLHNMHSTMAPADRLESSLPVLPLQHLSIPQNNNNTNQQQQQQQQPRPQGQALSKLAAALGADVVTPGGPLPVGPSALLSHLSDVGLDGDVIDTATSPAMHALAAAQARVATQNSHRLAAVTMTGAAAKVAAGAASRLNTSTENIAPVPGHVSKQESMDSGAEGSQRGKRPRRAASGGVHGAVAAATSDWGLDIVSPPHKRSYSVPDAGGAARGTAAAASQRDRNALLRMALHHGAAAPQDAAGDEADAISALVSMNTHS